MDFIYKEKNTTQTDSTINRTPSVSFQEKTVLDEKLFSIGTRILNMSRTDLYLGMKFLDVAVSSFSYACDMDCVSLGTDGSLLYFHPQILGGLLRKSRIRVNRLYLHQVFHCIFHHLWKQGKREKTYWHLACDIAAESVIDSLSVTCIRLAQSALRQETYHTLKRSISILTAEKIYFYLIHTYPQTGDLDDLIQEFHLDDHSKWPTPPSNNQPLPIPRQWQDQSDSLETNLDTFAREQADQTHTLSELLQVSHQRHYDYKDFLLKFSAWHEEMTVDDDSFDYISYSYGLQMYGNMPFIEPLEYKEVQKIQDFIIVIDTSMSCSGDLVRSFLKETYGILMQQESFYRKLNLHIIQCDDQVRDDKHICSKEELEEYMDHFTLIGQGGTDFRPAFTYVEQLLSKGAFHHLKGLLYFTDGEGIYPIKKPPYDVAFLFFQESYKDEQVPSWAMKLLLDSSSLLEHTDSSSDRDSSLNSKRS